MIFTVQHFDEKYIWYRLVTFLYSVTSHMYKIYNAIYFFSFFSFMKVLQLVSFLLLKYSRSLSHTFIWNFIITMFLSLSHHFSFFPRPFFCFLFLFFFFLLSFSGSYFVAEGKWRVNFLSVRFLYWYHFTTCAAIVVVTYLLLIAR